MTHYLPLTDLASRYPCDISNYHMSFIADGEPNEEYLNEEGNKIQSFTIFSFKMVNI